MFAATTGEPYDRGAENQPTRGQHPPNLIPDYAAAGSSIKHLPVFTRSTCPRPCR